MVLEERLLFTDAEDADAFIDYLKTLHCSARGRRVGESGEEVLIRGNIRNLLQLCSDLIDENGEDQSDPASRISLLMKRVIRDLQEGVLKTRYQLGQIMSGSKPGDLLEFPDSETLMNDLDEPSEKNEKPPTHLKEFVGEQFGKIICRETLLVQGIAEEDTCGDIRLVRSVDPDEIEIERVWHLDPKLITNRHLEGCITLTRNIYFNIHTEVQIDPKVHLIDNPGQIGDFLEGLSVDEDSAHTFISNLYLKRHLLDSVATIIGDCPMISLDNLAGKLNEYSNELPDGEPRLMLYTDPEFTRELVHDIQKLRIIRGNDRSLRLVT